MSLVGLVKISQNTDKPLLEAITQSLGLINYSFSREIRHVVIKPNLCYYWDSTTGQTTDPKFVSALIDLLRAEVNPAVEISIVESDASAMRLKYAYRMLGYEKLAKEKDVRLVNLSEAEASNVEVSCNGGSYSFMVPAVISGADLRINVAHIKYTVDPVKLTCALKNIFGCNPVAKKFKYHSDLGNVIVALNKAMKFNLCLIDNNIAAWVKPRRMGLVMASQDPVALDAVAARIAWLNPDKIPYLAVAEQEGVGTRGYIARGAELEYFRALYPKITRRMKTKAQLKRALCRMGLGKRLGLE
jgi:uncharacterized protein (DUF362 family)